MTVDPEARVQGQGTDQQWGSGGSTVRNKTGPCMRSLRSNLWVYFKTLRMRGSAMKWGRAYIVRSAEA